MIQPYLFISQSGSRGRGVFTLRPIEAGEVIEISPVIVMSSDDRLLLDKTPLHDYIFEWGAGVDECCMALGYIAVYNHSYHSNCEYEMNFENKTILVKTVRVITEGEELLINYNGDWNNDKPVWFEVK